MSLYFLEVADGNKLTGDQDGVTEMRNPSVNLDFNASSKVPLLYDSVAGAKNGNVISYSLDEQTIPNRYVDLSPASPGKIMFNGVSRAETPGLHLEQNDGVGEVCFSVHLTIQLGPLTFSCMIFCVS